MKPFAFIILLIISLNCFSQSKVSIHGTIVIAAIGSDGIILLADSRIGYYLQDHTQVCYWDSVQKIYNLNGFAVAQAGSAMIGGKIINEFFKIINSEPWYAKTLSGTIGAYFYYAHTYANFNDSLTVLIGAAYQKNGIPIIIAKKLAEYNEGNGIACNDSRISEYINWYHDHSYSCNELKDKLINAINLMVKKYHSGNAIGGPITVLKILPNNEMVYIQNNFSKIQPLNFKDEISMIRTGKIKPHYLANYNKRKFILLLEKQDKEADSILNIQH